jgi:threonine dehydrogenase-like Zn-dependent dehydrogenase
LTVRAVFLTAPRRMEVREVPAPTPRAGEVLLRVDAVGLCGSDHHVWTGEANYCVDACGAPVPLTTRPQLLGHEIVATVARAGRDADLAAGTPVIVDQGLNCASRGRARARWCLYCADGHSHQCADYEEHGITGLPGGLAEFLCVPAVNCLPRRPDFPARYAALAEPLACVLHASAAVGAARARFALGAADPAARVRSVLIVGAGTAGLLFTQVLRRVLGFDGMLIVCEPDPDKRALAERCGATGVDPRVEDAADAVRRLSGGGVEWLIEASGSGRAFEQMHAQIRKQATVLLYGFGHGGSRLEALNPLHWKEPCLVLPTGASGALDEDGRPLLYRRALQLLEDGVVGAEGIVTEVLAGLAAVPDAFASWGNDRRAIKGVVEL